MTSNPGSLADFASAMEHKDALRQTPREKPQGATPFTLQRQAAFARAVGLEQDQLIGVYGDANTILPQGITRPADWPPARR
jgi:hypothetical protein